MKLLKHNEKRWTVYKGWLQAAGHVVREDLERPECIHVGLDNDTHILSVSLITSPRDSRVRVDRVTTHNLSRELAEDAYLFMLAAIAGYCEILGKTPFFHGPPLSSAVGPLMPPLAQALYDSGWEEGLTVWDGADATRTRESVSPPDTIAEEASQTDVSNKGTTDVAPARKVARRAAAAIKPPKKKAAKKRTKPSKGATG
ncbi:MAG: hypothetical protein V3U34_00690 [candidate division NC10 bacterium]